MKQFEVPKSGPHYLVETSKTSNALICQDKGNGDIWCYDPAEHESINFKVNDLSENSHVLQDYMSKFFTESCDSKNGKEPSVEVCEISLKNALHDYDKFIFAAELLDDGNLKIRNQVRLWLP